MIKEVLSLMPPLLVEELVLRRFGREPATEVVRNFMKRLGQKTRLVVAVFTYASSRQCCSIKRYIDDRDKERFDNQMFEAMIQDGSCMVFLPPDVDFAYLRDFYDSEGQQVLSDKNYHEIFYHPIKFPRDFFSGNSQYLLIHHDGDPLVIMTVQRNRIWGHNT